MTDFKGVEIIGFDLDNTLYTQTAEADAMIQEYIYEQAAEILGVSVPEVRMDFQCLYKGGKGLSGGETLKAMEVVTDRDLVQEALEFADIASTLTPDPATISILEAVSESYRALDLLTGSDLKQTLAKLGALAIKQELFNVMFTREDYKKGSGDAYREWMAVYPDLSPEQFLYVGDKLKIDCEVPGKMGIRTALVNVRIDPELDVPQFETIHDFGDFLIQQL